jgi:flavin-dependent dehydrogenase
MRDTDNENVPLKKRYDVVIVGSGPAGASTAKILAGHGLDIAIIEKVRLPRDKMCSGILFPSSVQFVKDNFGDIPGQVYAEPIYIKGVRNYLTREASPIEIPFRRPTFPGAGNIVRRSAFDEWLCRCGDAIIVDQCRLTGFRHGKEDILIEVEVNNVRYEILTDYLVGADGTLSRVRKVLFPDIDAGIGFLPFYEEWYIGEIDVEPQWFYAFYDRSLRGFFAGLLFRDNQIIATTRGRKPDSAKDYFCEFANYLREKHGLRVQKRVARQGCVIHDMPATNTFLTGKGKVLLAGEAGGFIHSGEGISSALITGKAAGESILKSMDTGESPLGFYEKAVAQEITECKKAIKFMEKTFGVNPFDRNS